MASNLPLRSAGPIGTGGSGDLATIVAAEAARRRTFAIISHPDAGKTTLTERLLLLAGAIAEAGHVKARRGRRSATSDWDEMEQSRGISISSSVLRFEHAGCVVNLLDTPGHRDFSEDTLRVIAGVDFAVMVLDAARGVEEQTLQLFQVARERRVPLLTFVNKYDRPGMEPLGLLDHLQEQLDLKPAPVTWPVGPPGLCTGLIDRSKQGFEPRAHAAPGGDERLLDAVGEELELLDGIGATLDRPAFLAGEATPVFFGSALAGWGVEELLSALVEIAPAALPREDAEGAVRPLDSGFAAQVFKVQANMDPRHRDRMALLRICSGRFERGMRAVNARTGRPFALSYSHQVFGRDRTTVDEAYAGDVIGVVNAFELEIGDTLSGDGSVRFPAVPTLTPTRFARVRNRAADRYKQFRQGIDQLDDEGVARMLREGEARSGQDVILGGVGPMQFEVASHRLERQYGVSVELEHLPWTVARATDQEGARTVERWPRGRVLATSDGVPIAVFQDEWELARFEREHPEVVLDAFLRR